MDILEYSQKLTEGLLADGCSLFLSISYAACNTIQYMYQNQIQKSFEFNAILQWNCHALGPPLASFAYHAQSFLSLFPFSSVHTSGDALQFCVHLVQPANIYGAIFLNIIFPNRK